MFGNPCPRRHSIEFATVRYIPAARQSLGVESERVSGSSRHRYTGLIKLNHRTRTGAGQMNLKVE